MAPSVAFDMDSVESLETSFVGDFGVGPKLGGGSDLTSGNPILDMSRMQQRPQQVIRGVLRHAHTRMPIHNPDITKHLLAPDIIEEDIFLLETEATEPVEDLVYRTAQKFGRTLGKDLVLAPEDDSLLPPVVSSLNEAPTEGVDLLQYTKDTLSEAVTQATEVLLQSSSSSSTSTTSPSSTTTTSTSSSTTSTTTARTTGFDSGILQIPGHAPGEPADLNLIHHDRSFDEGTELNGISVKDDSTYLTPEGATTLILVGMIIVFLVFICLIMFIQKLRRQRIEAKVQADVDNEFTKTEAAERELDNYKTMSAINDQLLRSLIQSVSRLELRQPHELSSTTGSFMQTDPASTGGNLGQLWFSIYYDYTMGVLKLSILHASYPAGRSDNPADVWVECCVLTPLNTVMADTKTSSRKATVAPVFNQAFTFKARADEVRQCLLRLTLYDQQPKKNEKAVGSIIVPLSSLDLDAGVTLSRLLH